MAALMPDAVGPALPSVKAVVLGAACLLFSSLSHSDTLTGPAPVSGSSSSSSNLLSD